MRVRVFRRANQWKPARIMKIKYNGRRNIDVLKSTQTVIHRALEKLGYPEEVYELLKEPLRMLTVKIPVRMDDGFNPSFHWISCST